MSSGRSQADAASVNGALSDMKDDGTFTKIYKKWFHTEPPDSVLNAG